MRRLDAAPPLAHRARVPDSSPPRFPFWALVAAGAALVLGLAFYKDHQKKRPDIAPPLSLPLLASKNRQELKTGSVTIVDFWATWCAPCRASMPRVQHVIRDYSARGVQLLSVDTDNEDNNREPQVQEFLLQNQLDFPVVLDDGTAQDAFHVASLPTMLVVGKDRRIVWTRVGVLDASEERELRRVLDEALAAK